MSDQPSSSITRMAVAGNLAWLVPGLGHIYLGQRVRGLVFLVTIIATFWTGVAIGGVRNTVDPVERRLWFVAQLCTAGNTAAAWALALATEEKGATKTAPAHWTSAEVGVHYTGVAGLLNFLIVLDAIGRAEAPPHGREKRTTRGAVP